MADEEMLEVRRIRHEISEECGHDVAKVAEYYREAGRRLMRTGRFRFARAARSETNPDKNPKTRG